MAMKDHIGQHLKKAAAAAPAAASSTEDLDPGALMPGPAAAGTTVYVAPNPDNLRALRETYERLEKDADENVQEELQDTKDGLTDVRDSIDADNASGGLSAESACFAAMAVESYSNRLGIRDTALLGSLESAITASADGKMVVSTEALTASLEGVDHVVKEFGKRFASTVYRLVVPSWSLVKIAGKSLDDLIEKSSKLKAKPGATIKVAAKRIAVGDTTAHDVAGELQKAATLLQYLIKDFGKEAKMDYKANIRACEEAFGKIKDAADTPKAMEELYGKWRDPRRKLGGEAADPIIGNYRFFTDHQAKYEGDSAIAKKFDALANKGYPTLVGFQHYNENAADHDSRTIEIPALTPAEIAKIGLALKNAVKNYGFWSTEWERVKAAGTLAAMGGAPTAAFLAAAPGFITAGTYFTWLIALHAKLSNRAGQGQRRPGEFEYAEDIRTVTDALVTSGRLGFHVPYDAGKVLRATIGLYKKVAKLSLKAHAEAALEAFANANAVDGVTVNETAMNEPVQVPGSDSVAPEGEVKPKQDGIQDLAVMHQDVNGPTEPRKAEEELAQIAKDQQSTLPVPKQSGGPGLESHAAGAPNKARPYWFKG